jgi:hypothetical protein
MLCRTEFEYQFEIKFCNLFYVDQPVRVRIKKISLKTKDMFCKPALESGKNVENFN